MDGVLSIDRWQLRGANAEIISVLCGGKTWSNIFSDADWARVAQALDTRTPPNERVTFAMKLLRDIQRRDQAARWIPRFDQLPEHEFRQEFYPAYRDHSVHTLQVWLLGLYLFETVGQIREPLVSLLRSRSASDRDEATLFQRWWTFTALWHDTGYPFESEELASNDNVRLDRLTQLAEVLSGDGFQDGLRSLGIDPTPAMLAQFHRAGRHVPFAFGSVVEFVETSDENGVIDRLWRRLGLPLKSNDRAERFLDDLTVKAAAGRPPFHDHGTLGALLFLRGCSAADSFLSELTSALGDKRFRSLSEAIPAPTKNQLDETYLEFLEARPVLEMAAESIAYHNFNFRSIDAPTLDELFGPNGTRPTASLKLEPHLVFLAIADTLQDWDRHHFRPNTGTYRPTTTSDQMLLQGCGDKIRVALDNHMDPVRRVQDLFTGWIEGVNDLFEAGAKFSRPDIVQSSQFAPTIGAVEEAATKVSQLQREIAIAAERAHNALIRNQPRAIIEAADILEPVLRRIAEARPKLTQAHQNELDSALRSPAMQNVERHAVVAIQPGRLLPIGVVQERIGGGGFGEVYRVLDTNRGGSRLVAFKVFHGFEIDNATKRFYFERGFRAMESLRYEHGVVAVDRMLHVPFGMSMEYVAGNNLEEATKERRDVHERLSLLQQIAETLASAHHKGIIHRDVKPANVLLDSNRNGDPVLTDFDLAHITGKTTVARAHFASQLYGAPEQFNKRFEDWSRKPCVDIYGFGALMYHVLTFREPPLSGLFGNEQWSLINQSLGDMLPATAIRRIVSLVQATTHPNPRQRLESIEELQQMEYVVRELAKCRRDSASTDKDRMSWADWLRELAYTVTGDTNHDMPQEFVSRSGGTRWRIESREGSLSIDCVLERDPRFEGVNYMGFSRSSARQVDRTLESFGKIDKSPRARRHGQLRSAGSQMRIEIQQLELTRAFAREVGELVSALARAVE